MASKRTRSIMRITAALYFAAYAVWMLWLLFGQRLGADVYTQPAADSVNITPFATIERYLSLLRSSNPAMVRHAFINLVGNVIMFVPLGYFLPRIFPKMRRFFRTFFLSLGLILLVELVQYATTLGICDIDDLILNMAGVMIGYPFHKIKLN